MGETTSTVEQVGFLLWANSDRPHPLPKAMPYIRVTNVWHLE
ncbi:MAG: hypothetical protein PUP93_29315 [Rhizonema sp. NSF051]|nr:hypothetical protein [Rhizonema sp. NSF051]